MPNWCYNALYIIGKKKALEKLKKEVKRDDSPFSFRKIIPPPDDRILDTSEGYNGRIEGLPGGYDWCYENWGTKWDTRDAVLKEGTLSELIPYYDAEDMYYVLFEFDTAWSPPLPILRELIRKYPELEFHMHCEESGMAFICDYDYSGESVYPLSETVRKPSWYDSEITGVRGG